MKSFSLLLIFAMSSAFAQLNGTHSQSIGFETGQLTNGIYKNTSFSKAPVPKPLPKVFQANLKDVADKAFEFDSNALGMVLVDKGKIVYQRFNHADVKTEFMSWSMSKSLTNIMVGQALCAGDIKSISDKASQYVPDIKGTTYGDATIRELLTMTSGAAAPPDSRGEHKDDFYNWTRGFKSIKDLIHQHGTTQGERGRFVYDGHNTNTLGLVLEANKGTKTYVQNLLNQAGVETESHWMTDKDNMMYVSGGFGATLDDWAKLAQLSLDMLRGTADIPNKECMRQFMSDGTQQIIAPSEMRDPSYFGWGYTWTNPRVKNGYAWQGAYGQATWVHPNAQKILIVFRHVVNTPFYDNMGASVYTPWVLGKFN